MPEHFQGTQVGQVLTQVREALGEDALILRTQVRQERGQEVVEIVAAGADEVDAIRARLRGPRIRPAHRSSHRRPFHRIAVVGAEGSGKTTAVLKLARSAENRPGQGRCLGLLTLDVFRDSAVEELRRHAVEAGLPLEVVESPLEIPAALLSLRGHCDILLVDTPPLAPGTPAESRGWLASLEALRPDEVHVALPAGLRAEVAARMWTGVAGARPTHILPTRVDHLPDDRGLAELVRALDRPVRWYSDSPDPMRTVLPAEGRILTALQGKAPPASARSGTLQRTG